MATMAQVHRALAPVLGVCGSGVWIVRDRVREVAVANEMHDLLGQLARAREEGPRERKCQGDLDPATAHLQIST